MIQKQMYEKRIKKAILERGGGVGFSLISYFSTDKTLGNGYDISGCLTES